jgi:hypothetical protein
MIVFIRVNAGFIVVDYLTLVLLDHRKNVITSAIPVPGSQDGMNHAT